MKQMFFLTATVLLTLSTGCKSTPSPVAQPAISRYTQDAVTAGGHLNSDGSVTNLNGTVTQPDGSIAPASQAALKPAPAAITAPTPTRPAPVPEPLAARPSVASVEPTRAATPISYTAPAGTAITIRTTEQLSASQDEVGTRFHGVLESPVVSRGRTVFPAGASVEGTVVASKGKGRFKGAGALGIELNSIGRTHVETTEYEQENKGRGKRTGAFAGGGAGLGAIIGGIAGGGKGALIGGLAGAGGGTAAGAFTGSRDVVIRPESVITFRLTRAVTR